MMAAFKVYDRNGDGLITPTELLEVAPHFFIAKLDKLMEICGARLQEAHDHR